MRKNSKRCAEYEKTYEKMCWKWEYFLTDVLNKKFFQRCTASQKIIRVVLNVDKLCKRCAECEKIR